MSKLRKNFWYSAIKNDILKETRGIDFKDLIDEQPIAAFKHPDQYKYSMQEVFIVAIRGFIYFVTYIPYKQGFFLKTAYRSKKWAKKYLKKHQKAITMRKPKKRSPNLKKEYASLNKEEQEMLASLELGEWLPVPNMQKRTKELQVAANNFFKKDASVSMRLSSIDLDYFKARAAEEGIPHQTYIASILHKIAMGKFDNIKKPG